MLYLRKDNEQVLDGADRDRSVGEMDVSRLLPPRRTAGRQIDQEDA